MKQIIKSIIIISVFLLPALANAQQITGGYNLSYGKFKMGDLKNIQERDIESINNQNNNLQYKSIKTFPDRLFHDAYLGVKFSFHEIGLRYDYMTTGGRNHLQDYSGEIKNDFTVKGDALGVYYKFHFLTLPLSKDFSFSAHAGLSTGIIYNKLTNDYLFKINDSTSSNYNIEENIVYHSTNWYVQPTIGIQFWYKNTISLNINAGYLFDKQGKFQTSDIDEDGYYYDSYGNRRYYKTAIGSEHNFGADWTGLRLSVGLGFAFAVK